MSGNGDDQPAILDVDDVTRFAHHFGMGDVGLVRKLVIELEVDQPARLHVQRLMSRRLLDVDFPDLASAPDLTVI